MVVGLLTQAINFVMKFWKFIAIILVVIFVYNFTYDYFLPEYCVVDSSENRATISSYGIELSETSSSSNEICFRSKNQQLVQKMFQDMHDKQIEEEYKLQRLKEENRNKLFTTLLEPDYFYPILIALFFLGLFYIDSKKNARY